MNVVSSVGSCYNLVLLVQIENQVIKVKKKCTK